MGPYGRPLAMAATGLGQEDLHVLVSAPLRLLTFYGAGAGGGGGGGVMRRVELIGGGWGNYLDDRPYLVPYAVGDGGGERVGVVFPRKGYMVRAWGSLSDVSCMY